VATQVGVFASEDGGQSWSPTNEGPANVACRDLFWMGHKLVCVTHGRGMFEIDLPIANAFPDPVLVYTGSENFVVAGNNFTRYNLSIANRAEYPDSLFRPSPDLPPCGANANSSRTWVDIFNGDTDQRLYGFCALGSADDLDMLWFALPEGDAPPKSVYVVLRDRRCQASYRSNSVDIASSARELLPLPTEIHVRNFQRNLGVIELKVNNLRPNLASQVQIQSGAYWENITNAAGDRAWFHENLVQDDPVRYAYGTNSLGGQYRWLIYDKAEGLDEGWAVSDPFSIPEMGKHITVEVTLPSE
jgi:hypothetical protein